MTIDTNDILNSILESLSRIDYIHPEDIPNIDLYMDCLLYTSPSPRDGLLSRMPSSA